MRMTAELYVELLDMDVRLKLLFKERDPLEFSEKINFVKPYQRELQAYKIRLETLYSDFEFKEESNFYL